MSAGHNHGQGKPDAGMRHLDHYAANLPRWRYKLRERLIPIVRWETPYLALMQDKLRTPALDSYFAFTANLGTHTFFMITLPILFWFGYTTLARAMCNLLAFGVISSGIIKDLLCLPRPLSPPLQRITMSGSAALEYGFPSTHSTNAISVAVYALHVLRSSVEEMDESLNMGLQIMCYAYGCSIVFGRLYCGMHGFFDVVIGSILGAAIAWIQIFYGEAFDHWLYYGPYTNPLIATLIMLAIVRMLPEPADDCPCFDDSVAFSGVIIGVTVAAYTYPRTGYALNLPVPGTTPYSFEEIGLIRTVLRVLVGVVIVFAWRGIMKPFMFSILPPIFRVIENFGADLPRTFFLRASQYKTVPHLKKDDNVIPSARDIPQLMADVRQRRGRAVSIGPQSAADAYETIAYRQEQRRRSISKDREPMLANIKENAIPTISKTSPFEDDNTTSSGYFEPALEKKPSHSSIRSTSTNKPGLILNNLPTPLASRVQSYEQIMGSLPSTPKRATGPPTPIYSDYEFGRVSPIARLPSHTEEFPFYSLAEEKFMKEKEEIFGRIERGRVRYDVEVVTKLVVYAGIAWLAVQGNPVLFEWVGLGVGMVPGEVRSFG